LRGISGIRVRRAGRAMALTLTLAWLLVGLFALTLPLSLTWLLSGLLALTLPLSLTWLLSGLLALSLPLILTRLLIRLLTLSLALIFSGCRSWRLTLVAGLLAVLARRWSLAGRLAIWGRNRMISRQSAGGIGLRSQVSKVRAAFFDLGDERGEVLRGRFARGRSLRGLSGQRLQLLRDAQCFRHVEARLRQAVEIRRDALFANLVGQLIQTLRGIAGAGFLLLVRRVLKLLADVPHLRGEIGEARLRRAGRPLFRNVGHFFGDIVELLLRLFHGELCGLVARVVHFREGALQILRGGGGGFAGIQVAGLVELMDRGGGIFLRVL